MSEWIKVVSVEDVPPGKKKCVQAAGVALTLVNADGVFHALEDSCPHMGAPLSGGLFKGTFLTCGWHGWKFDVCTGKVMRGDTDAKPYPVKVEDGDVYVMI